MFFVLGEVRVVDGVGVVDGDRGMRECGILKIDFRRGMV